MKSYSCVFNSQSIGKMYLSWTDTSLCESGFVFDRDGSSFTPTYDFESPETCFTKHSPTSIFDDLTVTKVPPGSNLTYCIRAANAIGYDYGYRSNPGCQWAIVAWEASVRTLIRLPFLAVIFIDERCRFPDMFCLPRRQAICQPRMPMLLGTLRPIQPSRALKKLMLMGTLTSTSR